MNSTKQILVILVCLFLYAPVIAQEPQPAAPSRDTIPRDSRGVTVIIERQQLRFAAPASAQELRLEVFNQAGETVYDSGLVSGQELSWALQNTSGEAVPGGLYAYTLAIKEANSETSALRRGHLIIESGRDRIWVTNQGAVGAEESLSGGELTVLSGPETSVAGARIGRAAAARSALNLDFFGTPGRIPMFTGSDFLADSVIWQDFNGRIGIGTQRPGTALLTVAGQIETTSGGIKFPNGTVQTSSAAGALFQVLHNATLTGNGTEASPLGVNIPALGLLSNVAHNATLAGNGTSSSPLGVAVPLSINGSINSTGANPAPILEVVNNGTGAGVVASGGGAGNFGGGIGVAASGGDSNFFGGPGVNALGGESLDGFGGFGVTATGGRGVNFSGGGGLRANGGGSTNGSGGVGMTANGGASTNGRGGNGISAFAGRGPAGDGLAGEFNGNVAVFGTLSKSAGSFKIDHPLDPANKYLSHSFVESPDMMNVYNGNIVTDKNGEAIVTLPDYFEALNRDFRYQLTVIGQFAQAIVASEVCGNRFTIKTDRPGVKVSWQVTGVRQDEYANKHRIPVEEMKPERERGYYLHPQVFNQPEDKSLQWTRHPEMMREVKSRRDVAEMQRREKENDRR